MASALRARGVARGPRADRRGPGGPARRRDGESHVVLARDVAPYPSMGPLVSPERSPAGHFHRSPQAFFTREVVNHDGSQLGYRVELLGLDT
jgi:hypothetical protein